MLHLGFILILLGVLVSYNTQVSVVGWLSHSSTINVGGISVELEDIVLQNMTDLDPDSYRIQGRVVVHEGDMVVGSGYSILTVESGWGSYHGVLIIKNFWRDVYVTLHNVIINPITGEVDLIQLEVKIVKLISLIWTGGLIVVSTISTLLAIYGRRITKFHLKNNYSKRDTQKILREG
jgi:cytochrome c biogenesis factor